MPAFLFVKQILSAGGRGVSMMDLNEIREELLKGITPYEKKNGITRQHVEYSLLGSSVAVFNILTSDNRLGFVLALKTKRGWFWCYPSDEQLTALEITLPIYIKGLRKHNDGYGGG